MSLKIHVERKWHLFCFDYYIYEETVDGRIFHQPDGRRVVLQPGTHDVEGTIKPMGSIPENIVHDLVEALQRIGVQPKQLSVIEGKYQAQSEHLADLQNILKTRKIMS